MKLLIKNLKGLVSPHEGQLKKKAGKEMDQLTVIENAFLRVENGEFADFGKMEDLQQIPADAEVIDATGQYAFPSYVDSHTHLVYAGSREREFEMRIKGKSYEEIAAEGGGILNSAKLLRETSEGDLFESAKIRLDEIIKLGTGAVEIKSGYGLSLESELKMLRVARRLQEISPIKIKTTFLGAHAFPAEYKNNQQGYVDLVIKEMLPAVVEEELADYIDVFCDRGFFTQQQTEQILEAGLNYGLKSKIHANELDYSGGIQAGVKYNAVSVDHLECVGDEEIKVLQNSDTIPTVLPGTAFFLNMEYPPARKMIDSGLAVALASDYNPGSCPSGNMNFVLSLACIKHRLTPAEAINACTLNAAFAMEIEESHGAIVKNRPANFFLTKPMSSIALLPYAFGSSLIDRVFVNGAIYKGL